MVRTCWTIFARSGSSRYPGKCYLKLNGKILIEKIVDNLITNGVLKEDIYLCTSTREGNEKLVENAYKMNINVVTGSEQYPLKRILKAKDNISKYSKLVRICGDSPFYESSIAIKIIKQDEAGEIDFITNTRLRNFPSGQSVEVYNTKSVIALLERDKLAQEEEHMSRLYMNKNASGWKIKDIAPKSNIPSRYMIKQTIDVEEDFTMLKTLTNDPKLKDLREYFKELEVGIVK